MSQQTINGSSRDKALIYLVDDQPLLLEYAESSLQAEGYSFQKFHEPEEALRAFLLAQNKPDLLISDFAMERMNGMELIEKCKRAHPSLKTIMVSGTAGAEILHQSPVKIDEFLAKPYPPATLVDLVRRVLAG